jgi:hypothetical protein
VTGLSNPVVVPAGAITIKKEDPPTTVADLTTPSITVGTQVRLTGVVRLVDSAGAWVDFPGADHPQRVKAPFDAIEVIHQPFKRGEVVWSVNSGDMFVVFNDERDGKVDVVDCTAGMSGLEEEAIDYERRP